MHSRDRVVHTNVHAFFSQNDTEQFVEGDKRESKNWTYQKSNFPGKGEGSQWCKLAGGKTQRQENILHIPKYKAVKEESGAQRVR